LARIFRGEVELLSLDAGRVALLPIPCGSARYSAPPPRSEVFSPGGRIRTFALDGRPVLDAALDGPRLVVLQRRQVTSFDLRTGHPWPGGPSDSAPPRNWRTLPAILSSTSSGPQSTCFASPTAAMW
jgi:hypothetical protein